MIFLILNFPGTFALHCLILAAAFCPNLIALLQGSWRLSYDDWLNLDNTTTWLDRIPSSVKVWRIMCHPETGDKLLPMTTVTMVLMSSCLHSAEYSSHFSSPGHLSGGGGGRGLHREEGGVQGRHGARLPGRSNIYCNTVSTVLDSIAGADSRQ